MSNLLQIDVSQADNDTLRAVMAAKFPLAYQA